MNTSGLSCKVSEAPLGFTYFERDLKHEGASLTLQETRSIHDSMNTSKIEFIS